MTHGVKSDSEPVAMAIEVIIDNSGSMQNCKEHVVNGLNKFIDQLATAILPAQLSITLFDDVLKRTLVDKVLVSKCPRIRFEQYNPNWGTENIAHSVILALNERLAPINARQKALVVLTDGENVSPQMSAAKALVEQRQREGWLILWLGVYNDFPGRSEPSRQHSLERLKSYARGIGIPEGVTFAFSDQKLAKGIPAAAQATLRFGATNSVEEASFTAEERALVK